LFLPENQKLILENTGDELLIVIGVKANSIRAGSSTAKVKGK
jgi:hypothetical protein